MWSLLFVLASGARVRREDTTSGDAGAEGGDLLPQVEKGMEPMRAALEGEPERLAEDPMLVELAAQNPSVASLLQDGASLQKLQETLRAALDPAKIELTVKEVSQAVHAVEQLLQAPEFRAIVAEEVARLEEEPDFQELLRGLQEMQESAPTAEAAQGAEEVLREPAAAPASSFVEADVKPTHLVPLLMGLLPAAEAGTMGLLQRAGTNAGTVRAPTELRKTDPRAIDSVDLKPLPKWRALAGNVPWYKIFGAEPGAETAPPAPEMEDRRSGSLTPAEEDLRAFLAKVREEDTESPPSMLRTEDSAESAEQWLKIFGAAAGPENAPQIPEMEEAIDGAVEKALALRGGASLGGAVTAVKDAYTSIPLATRSWFSLCLGFAAMHQVGVLGPEKVALDRHALSRGQLWRPITAASFLGGLSGQLIQKLYYLVAYSRSLEGVIGFGGFLRALASCTAMLTMLANTLGWPFLADGLIAAVTVLAAQQTPDAVVNMYGVQLPMGVMPIAQMLLSYLFTQQIPWMDIAGSLAGYLHYQIQDEVKPDAAYYQKHPGKRTPPGAKTLGGKTKKKKRPGNRSSFLEAEAMDDPYGLDAKWTPNGDAPAPFSARARAEMGMDETPGGRRKPVQPDNWSDGLKVNLGALIVMYLANNWNVALNLQKGTRTLLGPVAGGVAGKVGPVVDAASKLVPRR
jgi:hypothetical protein